MSVNLTIDRKKFLELLGSSDWEIDDEDEDYISATYNLANSWARVQPLNESYGFRDFAIKKFLNELYLKPHQCSFQLQRENFYHNAYYVVTLDISSLPQDISWDFANHFFNIERHFQ